MKIWYETAAPTIVTGINKDSGTPTEEWFESVGVVDEMDNEFYTIDTGPPMVLVRKNQGEIDAIIAVRQAANVKSRLKRELEQSAAADVELFRLILDMWEALVAKGIVTNNDLPANTKTKAAEWKQKISEIDGA